MDLIKNLWCGDVPLVKAYWLFGVAVGVLFNISFNYIAHQPADFSSNFGSALLLALVVFAFIYSIFICVAIWRSAEKYQGPQINAGLAKIVVVLSAFTIMKALLELFGFTSPT